MNILLLVLLFTQSQPQEVDTGFHYDATHRTHLTRDSVTMSFGGVIDLIHLAMSDEVDDPRIVKFLKYSFSAWTDTVLENAVHEYGHISSLSMVGFDMRPTLYVDEEKFGSFNPASLIVGSMIGRPSLVIPVENWDKAAAELGSKYNTYLVSVMAGGLNQEQLQASRFTERYLSGNLSHLDCFSVIWANSSTFRYPLTDGDLTNYISALRQTGSNTSTGAIKNYSLLRFASGSSLKAFYSMLTGLSGAEHGFVKPISTSFGDTIIYWPEFQSYLTLDGPSVKTTVPIKFDDMFVLPSVEAAHGAEVGIRITKPLLSFLVTSAAIYHQNEGTWMDGSLTVKPWKWLGLFAGYEYGHGHTLHRDVFGATLDNTEHSVITGVDLIWKF